MTRDDTEVLKRLLHERYLQCCTDYAQMERRWAELQEQDQILRISMNKVHDEIDLLAKIAGLCFPDLDEQIKSDVDPRNIPF